MIVDTPDNVSMKLSALKAVGVTTIIRYLNPLGKTSKVVTPTEAHAIAENGLRMGLVSEGWGDFAHAGINAETGLRDARSAFSYAPTVGAFRGGATIYFAVDTDASDSQIANDIIPYFRAIADYNNSHENGEWSVGVYACGAACAALTNLKLVSKTWLPNAMGWNGSQAWLTHHQWHLRQHLPTHLHGVDVDVNDAGREGQIGDFVPFTQPPPPIVLNRDTTQGTTLLPTPSGEKPPVARSMPDASPVHYDWSAQIWKPGL